MTETGSFHVGEWEVLPDLLRIRRDEDVIEVEPRVMAVLEELVRAAGRVVTRDDLHRSVWSDVIVSDDALNRCIRELRRILGDDARSPRFIETISKRGYRLIAPVHRGPAPPREPERIAVVIEREVEVEVVAVTLFGHRALISLRDAPPPAWSAAVNATQRWLQTRDGVMTLRRENVVLSATADDGAQRFEIRTRITAAAFPLAAAVIAFVVAVLLLYGRVNGWGMGLGLSFLAAIGGWLLGLRPRERALDRSRAAIDAFVRIVTRR